MKKKTFLIVLVVISLAILPGCKSEEVKNVEDLISRIGVISHETGDQLQAVQSAFDALTDEDAKKVENIEVLYDKKKEYEIFLKEEKEKTLIAEVEEFIDSIIPTENTAEERITEAEKLYEALDANLKAEVSNYYKLEEYRQQYSEFQISETISLIESIGEVSLEKQKDVMDAEYSFNNLTDDEKEKIHNKDTLEKKLNILNGLREEKREKDKKDREDRIEKEAKDALIINNFYTTSPSRVGGVDLIIDYRNNSDKVIKYIDFTVIFYNKVGDRVADKWKYDFFSCEDTGPFAKGEGRGSNFYWGPFYVNVDVDPVMTSIDIEYMDGSRKKLEREHIKALGLRTD